MQKHLLTFFSLLFLISCKNSSKTEVIASKDYVITIETRDCLAGGIQFKAVIYNIPQYHLINCDSFKPHHLYITRQETKHDSVFSETYDLDLTPETEDSVFFCVHKYLMDFNIDNKEVFINGKHVYKAIEDGACLSVELEYDKKRIKCEQYNLEGIYKASPQIKKLLQIINSRVPDKFKLY
jgi:hypothetical protein